MLQSVTNSNIMKMSYFLYLLHKCTCNKQILCYINLLFIVSAIIYDKKVVNTCINNDIFLIIHAGFESREH